ncbi:DegT/DnrJ/EryC1/StrS family aminotransferase [Natrialbaceae archaeon A-chndr2]
MSDELAIIGGPKTVTLEDEHVFSWPIITEEDEEAALEVLRAGTMSDTGITKQFEDEFADWQGSAYTLGFSSGTASLLGAMYGVGVGVGDEVIGPSVTYWAAILPCLSLGATPVFADIQPDSLCIDPESFEDRISEHTKAVVVVHNYGHPADMDEIVEIAHAHDIAVIEDVSHAHGGLYKGRKLGTIGDVGAMSLMSRKSFPVGEGGILATDDREIYERAVAFGHYTRHGEDLERDELAQFGGLPFGGQKHRMHQISAAVGRVQLKHYDDRMAEIQEAMGYFWELLDDVSGISIHHPEHEDSTMGGWYSPKGLYDAEKLDGLSVERFAEAVTAEGSTCLPGCNYALHTHPLLQKADVYGHGKPTRIANAHRDVRESEEDLPVAEGIQEHCFTIPWFKRYEPEVIEQHADAYRKVVEHRHELLDTGGEPAAATRVND